jgi:hypothetical protein
MSLKLTRDTHSNQQAKATEWRLECSAVVFSNDKTLQTRTCKVLLVEIMGQVAGDLREPAGEATKGFSKNRRFFKP